MFLVPAVVGAWLLTFADPTDVRVSELRPALLAVGAAALWAAGTVLGRMVGGAVERVTSPRCGSCSAWPALSRSFM
jgi:drug/metabolite transporter, DME family